MPYRCANDLFTYCSGEPKSSFKTAEVSVRPSCENKNTGIEKKTIPCCELDLATCGKHQTILEQLRNVNLSLVGNTYKHTVVAEVKPKAKARTKKR